MASMGVVKSDRISQLTGSTRYRLAEAISWTFSNVQIKILLWRFCQRSKKSPLTETTVCQGRIKHIIRGATLIHGMTRALSGIPTYPRQMTSACNVAAYSVNLTFDCALSGPFDNLFLT